MQQRLSIAQAVICEPKILLLDEPFGALDPGITADMHELILRLWRENRMTIFMVSHDIQESFQLGTRLLTFDSVRHDPQAPEAYGASVTYDIPLRRAARRRCRPESLAPLRRQIGLRDGLDEQVRHFLAGGLQQVAVDVLVAIPVARVVGACARVVAGLHPHR